jgi:diguanylate cyclase (GGDEF)-like protein
LKQYEKENKDNLYSSMLLSLTHEAYCENEARLLWKEITEHMKNLEHTLGRKVGISVAALDYLSNVKNILNEPKIIEEEKSEFVAQSSTIDELTQLHLRDVFDITLAKHIDEAKRTNGSVCLLMIDIDDFKSINDRYGHQTGDRVLRSIGHCINGIVREMDLAARYGGEELAIILPSATVDNAYRTAERIRKAIHALSFDGFRVTVSIGVSCAESTTDITPEGLIKKSDKALYSAKEAGKNRTIK